MLAMMLEKCHRLSFIPRLSGLRLCSRGFTAGRSRG